MSVCPLNRPSHRRPGAAIEVVVEVLVSRELHTLLKERAQLSVLGWQMGLSVSLFSHMLIVSILLLPQSKPKTVPEKIRWVTLPAAGGGNLGGSSPTQEGLERGRQRRVEEVVPVAQTPPPPNPAGREAPNMIETPTPTPKAAPQAPKGTRPDTAGKGTARDAAKSEAPAKRAVPGAAGSGSGGGVGQGSGIPGLRASQGILGGTGLLQEFIGAGDFPLWYAQQVQDGVTRNWVQLRGGVGRVQIYFRILRTGKIEAARVEISSGRADLDDLALQAVRRTTLPRLPDEFDGDAIGVRFWFNHAAN